MYSGRPGIQRYGKSDGNIEDKFEALVSDMREKADRIGKYGDVQRYDAEHKDSPIGYTYVFINEVLSMLGDDSVDTKRISSAMISLLSEGRSSGYRIFVISQSQRRDTAKG